jgi:hypothetical protein
MPASYDFILDGDLEQARDRIAAALRGNGFAAEPASDGGLSVQRGSAARTLLLGALAGRATFMRFAVSFDDRGTTVIATLSREIAAGALRGGVIGARRTAAVFDELARRLGVELKNPV